MEWMDSVHIQGLMTLGRSKGAGRKIELRGRKRIINNQQFTGTISKQTLPKMLEFAAENVWECP